MGEIIFGVIGIGIISAAILNIVSTQRMWTKKIAFLLFSFMVAVTERNKTHKNILCRKNRILFYISYKKENGFGICGVHPVK